MEKEAQVLQPMLLFSHQQCLWVLNKELGEDKQRDGKISTPLALGINWATSAAILLHC